MIVVAVVLVVLLWPARQVPVRSWSAAERERGGGAGRFGGVELVVGVAAVRVVGVVIGSPLLVVATPILGFAGWREAGRRKRARLTQRRAAALVGFVEATTTGLRSGDSLAGAVHRALDVGGEQAASGGLQVHPGLGRVAARLMAGRSLPAAFADTFAGVDGDVSVVVSSDDRLVATTIEALDSSGVAALDALERVGDALRERTAWGEDVRTQAQQAMSSAAVMSVLPIVFGLLAAVAEPEVSELYRTRWLGALCVGSALVCSVAGWEWQRHLLGGHR